MNAIMKKSISLLLAALLALTSCSDPLNLKPVSDIAGNDFWKNASDVENGVSAVYYSLSKALGKGVYDWGELRGGNYFGNQPNGPDQWDIINNVITSTNSAALWTHLYQTINRANLVLKYAPTANMLPTDKSARLSECYAIRALCYFYIVRVWGDAPLFLEPVEAYSPQEVFRERTAAETLLRHAVNDLESAELYAQPVTNAAFKRSRINLMGIYAIMADVYAWMHEYDKVLSVTDKIDVLAPAASASAYWKLFDISPSASQEVFTENWKAIFAKVETETDLSTLNKERIFYLHYDELENGTNGNTSYFCNGVSKANPTEKLLSCFEPGDKRYASTFTNSNPKRIAMKFWPKDAKFGTGGVVSDGDIVLYRMSDITLLKAEAYAAIGKFGNAVEELNKIRTRSGLTARVEADFLTVDELMLAILQERTVEFVGEGKYWFDLLRTGHAADIGGVENPLKWVFPISKTHLDENKKLTQNTGYGTSE